MTSGLWRSAGLRKEEIEDFSAAHGVSQRLAALALARGLDSSTFPAWVNPTSVPWRSPYDFGGMELAVQAIESAVVQGTRIAVVGDYDVDGVSATVILCETLALIGANWTFVIPHRINDGYGISESVVDLCREDGAKILVTVDNGISAHRAVSYAASFGMTVIITDHHTPTAKIPHDASAVVHWMNCEFQEELKVLSGAAVAWKLSIALFERFSHIPVSREVQSWHMGLAGMAALADVMPMTGENRRLVRAGMAALSKSRKPGWMALLRQARVNAHGITETDLLWRVTPRLNAAGRMDSAGLAVDLLMTVDENEATRLADELEALNSLRQLETARVFEEALAEYKQALGVNGKASGLVMYGDWPLGVVGIVAAKVSEQFSTPAIVLADDGSGLLKGSGRAPEGFPLYDALASCSEFLHHFGGHKSAAGCAVARESVAKFASAFEEVCATFEFQGDGDKGDEQGGVPAVADDWLPLGDASLELVRELDSLRPFGVNSPEPSFFVGPVVVESVVRLSEGKHVRLTVSEDNHKQDLIWFQVPENASVPSPGQVMAAVVTLDENQFRGRTSVQMRVKEAFVLRKIATRRQVAKVYAALIARRTVEPQTLASALPEFEVEDVTGILTAFVELGFAGRDGSGYHVNQSPAQRHLQESIAFQRFLWRCVCFN